MDTQTKPPKLMDRVKATMWVKRCSPHTEKTYCYWLRYFIRFHRLRHPEPGTECYRLPLSSGSCAALWDKGNRGIRARYRKRMLVFSLFPGGYSRPAP
ncbi:phage integrase N-terminal SAM-like domain-containing protein [Vreelandella azerica]|uniref:phage integrase N-terminal SAM-like domain-containing protein n=1 Tax=Vreelandella azerica TaxID=2732867 RepID=UPI003BF49034